MLPWELFMCTYARAENEISKTLFPRVSYHLVWMEKQTNKEVYNMAVKVVK